MTESAHTIAVPLQTVTVQTTTTSTILLTKYTPDFENATSDISMPFSYMLTSSSTASSKPEDTPSAGAVPVLPPVVPAMPVPSSTARLMPSSSKNQQAGTSSLSPDESATNQSQDLATKNAIVGGLSGAIAGLVLIGLLLCFCLRIRKRRSIEPEHPVHIEEKGARHGSTRKWTDMVSSKALDASPPKPEPRRSPVIVDDHLISMSLDHWERPYAYTEGLRESMGPGQQLRCTNPDPMRPETSSPPSLYHSPASFLRRQRSALTAVVVHSNANRLHGSPNSLAVPAPAATVDKTQLHDNTATAEQTSIKSSASIIRPQTPYDPFVISLPQQQHQQQQQTPIQKPALARPRRTPIQSMSTTSASRTLSNFGSYMLNPFRTRSNVKEDIGADSFSRHSATTFASSNPSWRNRPRSDPFDLDRPSLRSWRGVQDAEANRSMGAEGPVGLQWRVSTYEGT